MYDVTVGYPDEIVSSEMEILQNGRFPHTVHFDVKRYKETDLPKDNCGLADWINKIWREKENRLENFYKTDIGDRKFLSCNGKNNWPVSISFGCLLKTKEFFNLPFLLHNDGCEPLR